MACRPICRNAKAIRVRLKFEMSSEYQPLADALYWEKVERTRRMKPEERMIEGIRMFDRECEMMRLEILKLNPNYSEADVSQEIRRRMKEADAENEANFYYATPLNSKQQ
jgi:hypothetical protein